MLEPQSTKYLIATDLDGTLLDHHSYSHASAEPALTLCQKLNIPVIFNTSKTVDETVRLRGDLNNQHPYIVENGSAVIIPEHYFTPMPQECSAHGDTVRCFGHTRTDILAILESVNKDNRFRYTGFSDWNTEEIAEKTGLSIQSAEEANQRDYSEPLLWQDSEQRLAEFNTLIQQQGLKILQGGRFLHVLGETDKGKALNWLKALYEQDSKQSVTLIVLGDSDNDVEMLEAADIAILVRSPVRAAPRLSGNNRVIHTQAYGPEGWNEAILKLIQEHRD